MHSEAMWSKLSYKPVLLYSKKVDAYIVYWCGVGMTARQALSLAAGFYMHIWTSPKVKVKMWEEFLRVYSAGAFATDDWDQTIISIMSQGAWDGRVVNQLAAERHYNFISQRVAMGLLPASGVFDSEGARGKPEKVSDVLDWFKVENAIQVE